MMNASATPPDNRPAVPAPVIGTVTHLTVAPGDAVAAGQPLVAIESMNLEHLVAAPVDGIVRAVLVRRRVRWRRRSRSRG